MDLILTGQNLKAIQIFAIVMNSVKRGPKGIRTRSVEVFGKKRVWILSNMTKFVAMSLYCLAYPVSITISRHFTQSFRFVLWKVGFT